MVSDRERAAFEAGIKLGALYHQWVGTPISRNTVGSVETAIEQAVSLQPCVEAVEVHLERDLMAENIFGYSELRGQMFTVSLTTRVNRTTCRANLACRDGYPLMEVVSFDEAPEDSHHR